TRARAAAERAGIAALLREVEQLAAQLVAPAARLQARGRTRALAIAELDAALRSGALVIDACRRSVRRRQLEVDLRSRPVLFGLLRALAERWPEAAPRDALMRDAFSARRPNESHRARLRVELGRLRVLLRPLAQIRAQGAGYVLAPLRAKEVALLLPPSDSHDSALLALLADGQRWSTSALALALSASQRHVQRALAELERAAKVCAHGRGRSQRWSAPSAAFAPAMLLPAGSLIG
ncbi:MAG TPA: helix-turn-helix domain-containing protein, partial [Polyangiales bacterium]|nr:helix-turn-helix domain-containing protein [Polyangiales bacterium]